MSDQSVEIRVGRAVQVQVFHAEFVDGLESIDYFIRDIVSFVLVMFYHRPVATTVLLSLQKKIIWMSKAAHLYL